MGGLHYYLLTGSLSLLKTKYLVAALTLLLAAGCQSDSTPIDPSDLSLQPFAGDQQFQEMRRKAAIWDASFRPQQNFPVPTSAAGDIIEEVVVSASVSASSVATSITNNQIQGVDEGDIVKQIKDQLIVLRRGRLFTFLIQEDGTPVARSFTDIEVPDGSDAWYDEMLVYGNQIIVIGYGFDAGATLIHRFSLSEAGNLTEKDAHLFASDDYYNFENYPSRLVGDNLLFYMPRELATAESNIEVQKVVRGEPVPLGELFESNVIYQPIQQSADLYLHSVVICPLNRRQLRCTARSIVAPPHSTYFIDHEAMYLWLNASLWRYNFLALSDEQIRRIARDESQSYEERAILDVAVLYKIPLGKGQPTAVKVSGEPVNQFSFHADQSALHVLTQTYSGQQDKVSPVLWMIPHSSFTSELRALDSSHKTDLPKLSQLIRNNRFINDYVLYGNGDGFQDVSKPQLLVKNISTDEAPFSFFIPHQVDRIESLGEGAVIIGEHTTGVGFTAVGLPGSPWLGATRYESGADQVDSRSHSFNYTSLPGSVLIGFPTVTYPEESGWREPLPVDMRFLTLDRDLNWNKSGVLTGDPKSHLSDGCLVSCEDWYGTARAFFIGGRAYALMDYELISADVFPGEIIESARADGLSLVPAASEEREGVH